MGYESAPVLRVRAPHSSNPLYPDPFTLILPGGSQHQREDAVRVMRQALQDGQRKGRRLSAAGVRRADHVTARQDGGYAPPLDLQRFLGFRALYYRVRSPSEDAAQARDIEIRCSLFS